MSRYILLIALLIGGATPPADAATLRGGRSVHLLEGAPEAAAACLARNIREHTPVQVDERQLSRRTFEVVVRLAPRDTLFIAQVEPRRGGGSRATIWRSGYAGAESLLEVMVRDC